MVAKTIQLGQFLMVATNNMYTSQVLMAATNNMYTGQVLSQVLMDGGYKQYVH